ncbi:MAG TPA: 50S ribosomal protein L15 [Acidimicrobiia bacterium]|jgi:large subunit ribosomal protein L15|nr:50S ribosomal protein L15 [Acidimicrobiia bacterium]
MAEEQREQLKLHHLQPAPGSKKKKVRVGRGESGKRGKTAGRGTKGLKARGSLRPGFEGGQTPLTMRLPKLPGFKNPNKEYFAIVNLATINQFDAGTEVTPEVLRDNGLIRHRGRVKVLAEGDVDRALTVKAHAFSAKAKEKIEAAGGTAELIEG